LIKTAAPDERE